MLPPASDPTPIPKPALPPTHEGFLSRVPTASLNRLAKKTGLPAESIPKLAVKESAGALFDAILSYAALSPAPDPSTPTPLQVQQLVEDKGDSDSEESNDSRLSSQMFRHRRRLRFSDPDRAGLTPGSGLRKPRIPQPKFELGTSETSVVWPPPPQLQAGHLAEERELARKLRKTTMDDRDETNELREPKSTADGPGGCTVTDGLSDAHLSSGQEPIVIHLVHYTVGTPKASFRGMLTYEELLLASTDGPDALRRFTKQVLEWYVYQHYERLTEGRSNKFALHRFKVEGCGTGHWEQEGFKRARPVSSVILPEGQIDAILDDVRNFIRMETKRWYVSHGLPHRRSYLFYGAPGTGKTSTIRVMASTFGLNCCYLSMGNKDFSNQLLGDALSQIPANALIVLEDVDALFNEDRKNAQGTSLTFSGLLNALDGLISSDGIITVMTTNHIERLDKALIRGGRVDRRFHFPKPNDEQIQTLFRSFYPETTDEVSQRFLEAVYAGPEGDEARAISTLQQLFIEKRSSSDVQCVASVPAFFETHFPNDTKHEGEGS